jgi:N-acetylneuraminic acid mutarotase
MVFLHSTPNDSIVSAASTWNQTTDEDFDNGTLNNLTIFDYGSDAELTLDFPHYNDWTEENITNGPHERMLHAMATVHSTDKILLYSGYYYDFEKSKMYYLNDTWTYDLSAGAWNRKYPTSNPDYRFGHEMAGVFGTDKVVLFGGRNRLWAYVDDTWIYDFSETKWTYIAPQNSPGPRYRFGMASVDNDDKIVLFGGDVNNIYSGETWVYDLSDNKWYRKSPNPTPPKLAGCKLATIYGTDKVMLFGGMDSEANRRDETWIYDISDNKWTKRNPSTKPESRENFAME